MNDDSRDMPSVRALLGPSLAELAERIVRIAFRAGVVLAVVHAPILLFGFREGVTLLLLLLWLEVIFYE